MAGERSEDGRSRSNKYHYLDKTLYKYIAVNRALGYVYVLNMTTNTQTVFGIAEWKKKSYRAYTIYGAAKMMNKSKSTVHRMIRWGYVRSCDTVKTKGSDGYPRYFLSKEALIELHDALSVRPSGHARKDGLVVIKDMPTKKEIESEVENDVVLYAMNKDGEFVRVWEAESW